MPIQRIGVVGTIVFVGAVSAVAPDPGCKCASRKEIGVWCDACAVGHVAAVRIKSVALFQAIDAHGHHTNPESLRCEACRKLAKSGGYCDSCRTGFVSGKAYFSKLTYLLARGTLTDSPSVKCKTCRGHTREPGWCDTCSVGMIGHIAFKNKEVFNQALKARDVLLRAVEQVDKCLSCAIAMAVDRECRRCRKSYKDGKIATPIAGQGK